MAYNLPMQINLQAPPASNISSIKKSIEAGIGNIKVADIGTASFAKANAQVKNLTKTFDKGADSVKSFFDLVEGKARSYAAYAVASTAVLKLAGTVSQAAREAIKYEKELINIAQTTGDSVKITKDYSSALVDISKKYNISLSKAAQLTRILAQTGMGFRDAAKGAEILARTSLLAGFDDLQDTTEGLIATMQTFEVGVVRAGKVLESINTLSKKYAVESGDLVEAIRRAGAAFSTSGGQIEELLALFTAVRSTTRESAETIATGFRTIFARLQRPKTIEFFKQLGIELETAEGKFIGPYQAIIKISEGLKRLNIQAGDVRFAAVVEQIGGIRQISRVVPLLEQVRKAQEALAFANESGIDSVEDLQKAQQGLGYRLGVLQKEFGALISEVVNSSSFKFLADIFINLSSAVIKFTQALAPLMPFLATMAAWKISTGLGKLLSGGFKGFGGGMGMGMGMAYGGLVPGSGNRDTVPAMLTPGEFVIRKSAVNAIGASRLASINKYKFGGKVKNLAELYPSIGNAYGYDEFENMPVNDDSTFERVELTDENIKLWRKIKSKNKNYYGYQIFEKLLGQIYDLGKQGKDRDFLDFPKKRSEAKFLKKGDVYRNEGRGNNEETIAAKNFLFENSLYKGNTPNRKVNILETNKISNPATVYYVDNPDEWLKLAKGGPVGTDTVPAMLTPGEFVVNKKSAQAYGYANLKRINKYKNGGMVGSAKGNINTDLQRGTGEIVYTLDELKQEVMRVVTGLGDAANIVSGIKVNLARADEMQYKGRTARGAFIPEAGQIKVTEGRGTQSTVAHEIGHAVDYNVSGGTGYASEQEGTLQNTLAKLAKDQIEAALRAKGASEEDIKYRTELKELFADLFEKSQPEVRAILASTTDVNEGMHQLAKVLDYSVASYYRLYGDIQKNLEEAVDASGRETFKVVGPPTPKPTVTTPLATSETFLNQLAKEGLPAAATAAAPAAVTGGQDTFTKRKFEEEVQIGGKGAIQEQIQAEAKALKELEMAELEAKKARDENKANLQRLDDQIIAGIEGHKAQNRAIERKIELEKRLEESEQKYLEANEKATEARNRRAELAAQARGIEEKAKEGLVKGDSSKSEVEVTGKVDPRYVVTSSNKLGNAFESLGKIVRILDMNFIEFAAKAQTLVSGLSAFAGLNVNQSALTQAQVKGSGFAAAGEVAGMATRKNVFLVGKALEKLPGKLGSFGTSIAKNAGSISKQFATLAKGFNLLGNIEIVGGVFDALMSTDYAGQRDQFIELGNATSAATAAAKAYAQEQYRSIPIIGGFLAGLGFGADATEASLDANGKLAVSNARLAASINGVDKEVSKAKQAFSEAQAIGDTKGQQKAISAQLDASDRLKKVAAQNQKRAEKAGGANSMTVAGAAVSGAAIGATIGSVVPIIGTALGGLAGAVVGGVAGFVLSSKYSTDQIVKGYGLQADAIRKAGEIQVDLIKGFGSSLQSEAVRVLRAGGTYKDALSNVTEQIGGKDVLNRILGGRGLSGNIREDIKGLQDVSAAREKDIIRLREERTLLSNSDKKKRAAMDTEIAKLETDQKLAEETRNALVQTEAAMIQEKKLIERRRLEAAAMEYQIKIMKKLETQFDSFNAKLREIGNISQEIENIGTGKLTTRQAAAKSGINNANLFEMDAKEIMRNPKIASEMASLVTRSGGSGEEIIKAQNRMGIISQLGGLAKSGALGEINLQAKEGEGKTSAKDIQDRIYEKLRLTEGADPVLDESVRKYAERIVNDGLSAAGQAEEDARSESNKLSEEIIRKQQEKLAELFQAEQKYRDLQIEQVNRQAELAKKVYENEKAYFEERFNLITKVQDFLQQEPTGPRRAGFLAARGANRRDVALAGLEMRRGAGFGGVNAEVNKLRKSIDDTLAKRAGGEDVSTSFANIQNESEKLINTIRDEIGIQEQYLDSLMESAKAQQEYTQSLYDAQGSIVRDLVTGTDEEVGNQLRTLNAAAIAAQQGSFAGIPENMKKDIFNVFDQFADVVIPGLGITGRDAQREITKNEYMSRFGVDEAKAAEMASKAVQDRVPIDQRMAEQIKVQEQKMLALLDEEKRVKNGLLLLEADNNRIFGEHVTRFGEVVDGLRQNVGSQIPPIVGTAMNAAAVNLPPMIGQAAAMPGRLLGQAGAAIGSFFSGRAGGGAAMAGPNATVNAPIDEARQKKLAEIDAKIAQEEKNRRIAQKAIDSGTPQLNMAKKMRENANSEIERLKKERESYAPAQNTNPAATPNVPAAQATPANTGQNAKANAQQPIQVQTQGQAEITVRLPDIQALVNQAITATVMDTVAQTFTSIAENVRSATNFDDVANSMIAGIQTSVNREVGGNA